jgi:hypothetical protein
MQGSRREKNYTNEDQLIPVNFFRPGFILTLQRDGRRLILPEPGFKVMLQLLIASSCTTVGRCSGYLT